MRWARAFNGHLADHHQFLSAHTLGRIASLDADITRHRQADRGASGPFHVEHDLDTGVLIAEDLGAAPAPCWPYKRGPPSLRLRAYLAMSRLRRRSITIQGSSRPTLTMFAVRLDAAAREAVGDQ